CNPPSPPGRSFVVTAGPGTTSTQELQREERKAEQRKARRDAALRALARVAQGSPGYEAAQLALGYLLAERAYEDARAASWKCNFCELGPPNVFKREAFVASLGKSQDLRDAM